MGGYKDGVAKCHLKPLEESLPENGAKAEKSRVKRHFPHEII